MQKHPFYDKQLDLVRKFGKERYDIWCFRTTGIHASRAWNVKFANFNAVFVEYVFNDRIDIVLCFNEEDFVLRPAHFSLAIFDNDLFAESIRSINLAFKNCDVTMCRKIVDEWAARGKVYRYGEAHNFLINNRS